MGDLAVVVTTYMPTGAVGQQRMTATLEAIEHWHAGLHIGDRAVDVQYVIADDGSDLGWLEEFTYHLNNAIGTGWLDTRTQRQGCGAALAAGVAIVLERTDCDVLMYCQDDWTLADALDLAPSLGLLESAHADVIRFGPPHPNISAHVARTNVPGAEWCVCYDWYPNGGYVVGWRPALYHRKVFDRAPLTDLEGLSAIEAERVWLERVAATLPHPTVFHAPNCTLAGPFRHIDTVELGEDDPETLTARYVGG